jgi:hypothetical protein
MLGLGSSISHAGALRSPVAVYESDFSTNADSFTDYSIASGTTNYTAYNPAFEGEDNTLRVTFEDAESNGGVKRSMSSVFTDRSIGDEYVITLKIFLDSAYDSVTNGWEGVDDVDTKFTISAGSTNVDIPQNEWVDVNVSVIATNASGAFNEFRITWGHNSGDQIQDGARFYLKDVKIEQFK